jgi:hypothetical protein
MDLRTCMRRVARLALPTVAALALGGLVPGGTASAAPVARFQAVAVESSGGTALTADPCDTATTLMSYIFNANTSVVGVGVVKSFDGQYDRGSYDRILPVGTRTDSWGWKCASGFYIGDPGFCVDSFFWNGSSWQYGGTRRDPGLYEVSIQNMARPWRFEIQARRC